ncbi:brachyurin-like [Anopheles albimanus]|uniref:brachyurin-like n=1 Tax=Anopheles albimanus TaxID=7167 RepID=UPI0016421B4E|nr:brachyurin-like [Anopheles albimanus]
MMPITCCVFLLLVLGLGCSETFEQKTVIAGEINWSSIRPIEDFDHYWTRLPAELQKYRHAIGRKAVTNGFVAVPGQFPYFALLLPEFTIGTTLCGGTILTNNYILTAAHCVALSPLVLASGGTAILGAYDRSIVEPEQQRIRFDTSGITVHPGYTPLTLRNDIATVLLNTPISYSARIQAVRLPTLTDTRTFAGMLGTVSGFGRTSDTGSTSNFLRYASNLILTNGDCSSFWPTPFLSPENVCMSGANGRSPCFGDSGGPLTVSTVLGPLQVGIVSFGDSAGCSIGIPSVYVRVTYFLQWILDNSNY